MLRISPCNWYVSKFDPSVDQNCAICEGLTDNIPHYFYDCDLCREFWNEIEQWIGHIFNIGNVDMYIKRKNVILGLLPNVEFNQSIEDKYTINFIIVYAKWFIYIKKKNLARILQLSEFVNVLKTKLHLNYIVAKHQRNNLYLTRMSKLVSIFELDS